MSVRKRIWTTRKGETKEVFVVDYSVNGQRRHETFQREDAALDRAARVRVDVRAGKHVALDNKITFADIAERWIKRAEADQRERATIVLYRGYLKHHLLPHLGRIRLAKLTPDKIEDYRDSYLLTKDENGEPLRSPELARKIMVSLRAVLRNARCGHLAEGIRIAVDMRGKRKLEIGRDVPSNAEIKRLIDATAKSPKKRALLLMAAFTGLRASELRGLRWYDVDLEKGELHVRQRADKYYKIGPPKSESSRRRVPLDPAVLIPALKVWKLACPKGELDLVFPTRTGKIEGHANIIRSLWPVMRDAGVVTKDGKAKYALHAFRHYFASWSISPESRGGRGMPPKVVQEWLGHSNIAMTLNVYSHLLGEADPAELAKSVKAVLA
jgi:integrase